LGQFGYLQVASIAKIGNADVGKGIEEQQKAQLEVALRYEARYIVETSTDFNVGFTSLIANTFHLLFQILNSQFF